MYKEISSKTLTMVIVPILAALLFGCGENPESVFLETLETRLAEEGERCFGTKNMLDLEFLESGGKKYLAVRSGPVMNAYAESQARGREMVKRMQQADYLGRSEKKMRYNFGQWVGYQLTATGRKAIIWNKGVCVGTRNISEIIEYTEPADMLGRTFTEVRYKYTVSTNDLVADLGLEEKVKARLPGESTAVFVKTNKGWRLN